MQLFQMTTKHSRNKVVFYKGAEFVVGNIYNNESMLDGSVSHDPMSLTAAACHR